ncbi:alpha/beta hydrolase [Hephaestia caeni]|uniref:alpha/beta hydrolase n=1 Tax=Hephaestia caeni TaxID=645617 RepID=UPI001B873985|nr:alpha/beta hydrolase [Hephaestia caeni]
MRTPLWAHGAPGFEDRAAIPELTGDYWTKRVNNPGITAFLPPRANATGTAIVVVPGGGHRLLVTTTEGDDVGRWLAHRGIAAFVVRYRLFREEGSPYTLEDARADVERAVRSVRARAGDYAIDPHRIGIWGFSAGGELARMTTLSPPVPARGTPDAIDALSARPDFAILEFPGPLHAAEHVTAESPPLLLGAANDDACCSAPTIDLLQAYRQAGASAEIHLYAAGGHAFNLGEDTPLVSLQHWPQVVLDWLSDRGLLGRPAPVFTPK